MCQRSEIRLGGFGRLQKFRAPSKGGPLQRVGELGSVLRLGAALGLMAVRDVLVR